MSLLSEYYDTADLLTEAENEIQEFWDTPRTAHGVFDIFMRNLYASACIKVYSLMTAYANTLSYYNDLMIPHSALRTHRTRYKYLADIATQDILDSLPRALDPRELLENRAPKTFFDAVKLMWPLRTICDMPITSMGHKMLAARSMRIIGREIGLKQALQVYPDFYDSLPPEARQPFDPRGEEFERPIDVVPEPLSD